MQNPFDNWTPASSNPFARVMAPSDPFAHLMNQLSTDNTPTQQSSDTVLTPPTTQPPHQSSGHYITLYPAAVKQGKSVRVDIGEVSAAEALINLLRGAHFIEDAIYIKITSSMIKNNRLFGIELTSIPKRAYFEGQAAIRYFGRMHIDDPAYAIGI